jgi:hypothetical protein
MIKYLSSFILQRYKKFLVYWIFINKIIMATARPFAYNPSLTPIEGTIQVGDLAPWINGDCGLDGCMPNPGIIWYWVR